MMMWFASFLLFPGFNPPMSPTMPADQVAAFYRDPAHLPEIRYSMIVFNWFGVCLVPILTLIVMQIRRMAHRTPIFSYAMLGCVAGGPPLFLVANGCWLLAPLPPERSPGLTQLLHDFARLTFPLLGPTHRRIAWHLRQGPKRELWLAWSTLVVFYNLFFPMVFVVAQVQPPPAPAWDLATQVHYFHERHLGIPIGLGFIFAITGMT